MQILRRALALLALVLATSLTSPPASAAEAYDPAAVTAAQKAGKSVLVVVHAPWCPTCKAQEPIINALLAKPEFKDMAVFRVDFDSQREVLKALNARQQSTLIVYKGEKEIGRTVGDTKEASIESLLKSAL